MACPTPESGIPAAKSAFRLSGIETVWFHVGSQTVRGCIGCEQCHKARKGECVFGDEDGVNELISLAEECDGFVFGSPVHFAALSGSITSLLDRVFYASSKSFYYKPAACLVSCRRAGSTAALEQLLKYPSFARMPVVSSQYWNMVHGNTPDEVRQDLVLYPSRKTKSLGFTRSIRYGSI